MMQQYFAESNAIPAIFWIGHLVVALMGLVLLRRRAGEVPSARRVAYHVAGGLLIVAGLVPAAFASIVTAVSMPNGTAS